MRLAERASESSDASFLRARTRARLPSDRASQGWERTYAWTGQDGAGPERYADIALKELKGVGEADVLIARRPVRSRPCTANCAVMAAAIPAGSQYTGYRYEAREAGGVWQKCSTGIADCPIGWSAYERRDLFTLLAPHKQALRKYVIYSGRSLNRG